MKTEEIMKREDVNSLKKVSKSHTQFMLYAKYHYERSQDVIGDLIKIYKRFYVVPDQVIDNDLEREYCIKYIFSVLTDMVYEYYLKESGVNQEYRFHEIVKTMRNASHDVGYILGFLSMISLVKVKDVLELAEEADETLLPLSKGLIEKRRLESLDNKYNL